MRGSMEAFAVARDVASSSPSKNPSALDMMRYQRMGPDSLPLGNGGGSRKTPAPASRSSKDDDAPVVATDSSRLPSYLAAASVEPKPRARAPHPPPLAPAPAFSPVAVAHPSDFTDHTSPSPNGGGASGSSAGSESGMMLQWGHNKRSRRRRDASSSSASSSAPIPAEVRRLASIKIKRRASARAEKLMPPPSNRGSNLRISSSLPPRVAADAPHGRNATLPHQRSVEERAGGQSGAATAAKQRPASDKAHRAEAGVVLLTATPEPKHQVGHHQADVHGAGPSSSKAVTPSPSKTAAAAAAASAAQKPELPRINLTLSRKEKEEDFMAMKGTKLPQRPKKRPKAVEKAVNYISPGMWLTDVTRRKYEVREKKSTKKKRRGGLKGMESSDTD